MSTKIKCWIVIAICMVSLFFTGCASINYTRVVYEDGSMKDVYEITFDRQVLLETFLENGYTIEQATTYMNTFCQKTYEIVKEYENKVRMSYQYELSRAVLTGQITPEEYEVYVDQIQFLTVMDSVGYEYVRYSRVFTTPEVVTLYQALYDTGEDSEDDGYELEDGFFFYRYAIEVENFYQSLKVALEQDPNVFSITYDQILQEFGMGLFTEADLTVTQDYISSDSRLHSNADYTAQENGYYLQEWNILTSEPTVLKYYYYIANTTNWYWLCVVIGVGVVGLLGVYLGISHYMKKKKRDDRVK